jgi:hypothetical protein
LNQQPRDDGVRDGNLVYVAPLHLGEEVAGLHGFGSDFGTITFWIRLR